MRYAFTIIELVFVIVVLGILSAIAIPKFNSVSTEAQITKGRSDISAIRSAIVSERQSRLIKGDTSWITSLSNNKNYYFDGNDSNKSTLLMYGIKEENANGHWHSWDDKKHTYKFKIEDKDILFTYNNKDGTFSCDTNIQRCSDLTD